MLVIAVETGSRPAGRVRWAGRRHDDDRPDASSGSSSAELFDAVFHALHDGEQVALGFDCPLTMQVSPDRDPAGAAQDPAGAGPPGSAPPAPAELGQLLRELGRWRPWTTVSTSLARWKANTSILVWQAVPASGSTEVTASAAADSFFRQFPSAARQAEDPTGAGAGAVVNLAAVAACRAGLFVDASELARPAVSFAVTGG